MKDPVSEEITLLREAEQHLDRVATDSRRRLEHVRTRLRELTAPARPETGAYDE